MVIKVNRPHKHIRVFSSPASSGTNPYLNLFYSAMNLFGVKWMGGCNNNNKWLIENSSIIDVIHLHWPEDRWRYSRHQNINVLHGLAGFWRYLHLARRVGIKIIWTVHNLHHHEGVDWADKIGYWFLAKYASLLICHSNYSKNEILKRWSPQCKIVVMKHGNYDGIYPDPQPKEEVLRRLHLDPGKPTVCCLGAIRAYKGIDIAVQAITELSGGVQLIVAGQPLQKFEIDSIMQQANNNDYIKIIPKKINDQAFSNFVSASDAMLLPYRKITGSGAFMAAVTLGCGVVASDLPYFREMLDGFELAGELYSPQTPDRLAAAINKYIRIPQELRSASARKLADKCNWSEVVTPVVEELKILFGKTY